MRLPAYPRANPSSELPRCVRDVSPYLFPARGRKQNPERDADANGEESLRSYTSSARSLSFNLSSPSFVLISSASEAASFTPGMNRNTAS